MARKIKRNKKQKTQPNKYQEIWKSISGYEPAYKVKVSSYGRVVILPEHKTDSTGREYVTLCGRDIPIDLLVAQAFIANPTRSEQPWHLNGDIRDCRKSNLRWIEFTKDPAAPQRIYSTISLLQYILHPNLLAERDKEFTRFYTYLDYLWKTGQMPPEQEQLVMDGYDMHRKRVMEDFIKRQEIKREAAEHFGREYVSAFKDNRDSVTDLESENKQDSQAHSTSDSPITGLNSESIPGSQSEKSETHKYIRPLSASGYKPEYDPTVTSADMEEYYGIRYEDIPNAPKYTTSEIINDLSHPNINVPKEMLAEALIDLYERAITTAVKNPKKNPYMKAINWRKASPLTDVVRKAVNTVVNFSDSPATVHVKRMDKCRINITSSHTRRTYQYSNLNTSSLLEKSLTAPYHLNTCPQLPPLHKEKELRPTHHLQSMIMEIQKTGNLPEWVTESVSDLILEMNDAQQPDPGKPNAPKLYRNLNSDPVSQSKTTRVSQSNKSNNAIYETTEQYESQDSAKSGISNESASPESTFNKSESVSNKAKKPVTGYDDYGICGSSATYINNVPIDEWEEYEAVITGMTPMGNSYETSEQHQDSAYNPDEDYSAENEDSRNFISDSVTDLHIDETGNSDRLVKENGTIKNLKKQYTGKWEGDIYIGNNRNPGSEINRDVHPGRKKIWSDDHIRFRRLPRMINSEPEFDEKGRPVRDDDFLLNIYDDSPEIPMAGPRKMMSRDECYVKSERLQRAHRAVEKNAAIINGYGPDRKLEVSPLYDPEKDITLGKVNTNAGLEESSYYNQLGQKVYHNVRYGEVYDPKKHTLYIPEIQAWPEVFSADIAERNYMDDYVAYLRKHYPEIGDPEILKKYYDTAKVAMSLKSNLLPNCPKNRLERRKPKSNPVRCIMRNDECMVFETVKQASEATGVPEAEIYNCCNGYHRSARGFRWEYIDMGDMDYVVTRYIKRIMDVVDECGMEVDWEEYINSGVMKRMDDVMRWRRKRVIGELDNVVDMFKDIDYTEEWHKKRKRAWEMLDKVKCDDLPEEWEWEQNPDFSGEYGDSGVDEIGIPDPEGELGNDDMDIGDEPGYYGTEMAVWEEKKEREIEIRQRVNEKNRISAAEERVKNLRNKLISQNSEIRKKINEIDVRKSEIEEVKRETEEMKREAEIRNSELDEKEREVMEKRVLVESKLVGVLDMLMDEDAEKSAEIISKKSEKTDEYIRRAAEEIKEAKRKREEKRRLKKEQKAAERKLKREEMKKMRECGDDIDMLNNELEELQDK